MSRTGPWALLALAWCGSVSSFGGGRAVLHRPHGHPAIAGAPRYCLPRASILSGLRMTGRTETVIDRVDEWVRKQTFGSMVDRQELKRLLKDVVSDDAYWQRQRGKPRVVSLFLLRVPPFSPFRPRKGGDGRNVPTKGGGDDHTRLRRELCETDTFSSCQAHTTPFSTKSTRSCGARSGP
jgi:hypothetical protein